MNDQRTFDALVAAIDVERRRLADRPRGAAAEAARLVLEEIWMSTTLAGAKLGLGEVTALVERGVAAGDFRLEDYVIVADYAAAVRYAAAAPLPGRHHVYLRLEEIVALHARVARREPEAVPGVWRGTTAAPFPSGVVPTPAWLVPREMAAFAERAALGPPAGRHAIAWVADIHERFARIHPFAKANGRVNRLLCNLLLRRCGLPPFSVRGRAAERYLAALRRADSRDPWPLAVVFARAILASLTRLAAASEASDDLRPLATFASGADRAALYKASQRGRLRTVRRGGALLTSAGWIAEYEGSRLHRSGRT
jgi:Fic family protein